MVVKPGGGVAATRVWWSFTGSLQAKSGTSVQVAPALSEKMALAPQAASRSTEKTRPALLDGLRPAASMYTYGSSEVGANVGESSLSGRFASSSGESACQVAPLSRERMTSVCARRAGAVEVGKSKVEAA